MSKDVRAKQGLIGPNAILQMLPVLDTFAGEDQRNDMLSRAGIDELPDGTAMIPEVDAANLHRQLRLDEPTNAPALAKDAGTATADYILAHRIPRPAQRLLKCLPATLAARMLSKAIAQHAWTFVGSGNFRAVSSWIFEIKHNPLIKGEFSDERLCHWHVAVFARLYQTLVARNCVCSEVRCGAVEGGDICRFEITRTNECVKP